LSWSMAKIVRNCQLPRLPPCSTLHERKEVIMVRKAGWLVLVVGFVLVVAGALGAGFYDGPR
jgi:hypothetical protein